MNLTSDEKTNKSCWIITEGIAGTENQCIGVAEALGVIPRILRIALNEPWKSLSPYLGFECAHSFSPSLNAPWPELLIASGRKSIAAARYIKKKSGNKTIIVQIQDPRISPKIFDLVAVPEHDPLRGDNVIVTQGSPNKITLDKINDAKNTFAHLGSLPSPRVAVLIGGSSKAYTMSEAITRKLANDLKSINASLMLTCSRRTGQRNKEILETELASDTNYIWNGQGDNPYMGFLGWADFILVTADSASMISESCTTGKPVYIIPLDGGARRITKLHNNLIKAGALRVFDGHLEEYEYEPLNDAKKVAQEINKRFGGFTLRD
ncbi:MAG: mitochondrial fission ELM1 family protein [Alphaproteobacteria bacterium]